MENLDDFDPRLKNTLTAFVHFSFQEISHLLECAWNSEPDYSGVWLAAMEHNILNRLNGVVGGEESGAFGHIYRTMERSFAPIKGYHVVSVSVMCAGHNERPVSYNDLINIIVKAEYTCS